MDINKRILTRLAEDFYRPVSARELAAGLKLNADKVESDLRALVESRVLEEYNGDYYFNPESDLVAGHYQAHPKGYGFVHVGGDLQYYVAPGSAKGAGDGDIVLCQVLAREPGKAPMVKILEFLVRRERLVAAKYSCTSGVGNVQDGNRKYMISPRSTGGAKDGDCVLAAVSGWDAKVIARLDNTCGGRLDLLNIAAKRGITPVFPVSAQDEAAEFPADAAGELDRRLDLRGEDVVTVDDKEARDLDDAFSLTADSQGNWRLGIHIADVAHYVAPGTALDREAFRRALSVYLVDQEIPMLPTRLSGELCSLQPNVDRLAVSCLVLLSPQGEVMEYKFAETVIKSRQRLSYDQVDQDQCGRWNQLMDDADRLVRTLKERRHGRGAVYISLPATSLALADDGQPVSMGPRESGGARELVEELMILINELAADYLFKRDIPFLYRGNEGFYPGRGEDLNRFLVQWGYELEYPPSPAALQEFISLLAGRPEEVPVSRKLARCLHKSRYSQKPLGHYNMAVERYTHFSSPIRRYSDLYIHRLIKGAMRGQPVQELERDLPRISDQCSFRERLAQDVEGECLEYKKLQYLEQAGDMVFSGIVVDSTGNGPLIWLDNTAEGVAVAGNREVLAKLRPGDRVQVRVHKLDYRTKQVYFSCPEEN